MVRAKITGDLNLTGLAYAVAVERSKPQAEAQEDVQAVLDIIGRTLANGHKVKLTNFGTFEPGRRRIAKGALGGKVERSMNVRVVKFHLNGRLLEVVRSGRKVSTLKKAGKTGA